MRISPFKILSLLCVVVSFLSYKSYAEEGIMMFRPFQSAPLNLKNVSFDERHDISNRAAELAVAANDPYAASLPMMIYAELGDGQRYQATKDRMITLLNELEVSTNPDWKWMQSNSFKAWMWGRVLLAAQSLKDAGQAQTAKIKLVDLLSQEPTAADNAAFATWGWAYRAAFDKQQYHVSKNKMMDGAQGLTDNYQLSGKSSDLSDELWGWVMNIQAAARANDRMTYEKIKTKIAGKEDIATVLMTHLSHTADSNDYPAWSLAKMRLAAAMVGDEELFLALKAPLEASIAEAKALTTNGAKAEYSFAVMDNKLAELIHDNTLQQRQQAAVKPVISSAPAA